MEQVEQMRGPARGQVEAARALPAAFLRQAFESEEAKRWPRVRLRDVCSFLPARSLRTDGDTSVMAVTTACLSETGFLPVGLKEARMDSEDVPDATLRTGEILIARSNTPELVGRVAQYNGERAAVVASDLTIRVLPNEEVRGDFLAFYLSALHVTGHWKEKAGGTSGSMKKIRRTQLADEAVPVPLLDQQVSLATRLKGQLGHAKALRQSAEAQLEAINALAGAFLEEVFGSYELPP